MTNSIQCSFRDCGIFCDLPSDDYWLDPKLPFCNGHSALMYELRMKIKSTEIGINVDVVPSKYVEGPTSCCAYILDLDYAISLREEYRCSLSASASKTQVEHNLWIGVLNKHRANVYSAYCAAKPESNYMTKLIDRLRATWAYIDTPRPLTILPVAGRYSLARPDNAGSKDGKRYPDMGVWGPD